MLVLFLFIFAAPLLQNLVQTGGVLGRTADISAETLVASTNKTRAQHDRPALTVNDKLTDAAEQKARDMLEHQYWAHTSDEGVDPWYWVKQSGYEYAVAGENLAKDFSTADAVVTAWMNSPEHRKNVLDERYHDVGVAVVDGKFQGKTATIVVALYGAERTSLSAAAAQALSQPAMLAAQHGSLSVMARMGVGLQSLTPTALASLIILLILSVVSLIAHAYRAKLPLSIRQSWRKHHGLYKAVLSVGMAGLIILLFGGGQI